MGFETVTTVKCSNPELVAQCSDFYNKWAEFRITNNDKEDEYFCGKCYILDALEELSTRYPDETVTGVTWRTEEYEDCKQWTVVYKAGNTIDFKIKPKYTFLSEVSADDKKPDKEILRLEAIFIGHLEKYFKRINLRVDPALYNQIEKKAAESYLKVATYSRQLLQQTINNSINDTLSNEKK